MGIKAALKIFLSLHTLFLLYFLLFYYSHFTSLFKYNDRRRDNLSTVCDIVLISETVQNLLFLYVPLILWHLLFTVHTVIVSFTFVFLTHTFVLYVMCAAITIELSKLEIS